MVHQRVAARPQADSSDSADVWDVLREGERVEAAQDLPGVPAGTSGVVVETYGLWWIRYRVRFDNGQELSLLDRRRLRRAGRS